MTASDAFFKGMSLYTITGERKYLTPTERKRFYPALSVLEQPAERTFVEMIYWTGCRPCEALSMAALQVQLEDGFIVIRSAKKRGRLKGRHFRTVPVPRSFIARLDEAHGLRTLQNADDPETTLLWPFGRTKGWRLVRTVMEEAGISGVQGCARGLRHTMGVHAIITAVPETRLQSWLGHADLSTTAIYVNAIGPEDRAIARRMWQ
ncbi:tyrosine-type recombinase/integrase [Roseibium sp.]|uniref:tyrosine-type recombinase/integrase n=1 Tax=Roseibium sp. TaxID=1936156 RepID=UPI003A979915